MNRDPIVEEVHRTRQKLLKECGGDLDRLLDRVKAGEKNHHDLLVTKTPLPAKTYVMKETESLVRSILGTVPIFGTALNEAFFDLRARLKHERLERFVEDLAKIVNSLETEKIDTGYIHSEEFVDFLEDVLIRATKIRAEEKREKLAAVLVGRMQNPESTPFDDRYLDLLVSLTEVQILILNEHLRAAKTRDESNTEVSDASKEHREPGFYGLSDSEYRFLVQDLLAKSLLYPHVTSRGGLGPLQGLEATELGVTFIRFLEKGSALEV
ncbi:MAG: hypothetical protein OXU79_01480 [Gemmatimonadota bacterium]|nr:hypothetical protein [Gemmatimonadota bacterium]